MKSAAWVGSMAVVGFAASGIERGLAGDIAVGPLDWLAMGCLVVAGIGIGQMAAMLRVPAAKTKRRRTRTALRKFIAS
jgi:hypothetical protein